MEEIRIAPHSEEAEVSVLGAILLDYEYCSKFISQININYFNDEGRALIFKAISYLHDRGQRVDMVSVVEILKQKGALERVGGAYYITGLSESIPSPVNIGNHISILREYAELRKQIHLAHNVLNRAYSLESSESISNLISEEMYLSGRTIDSKSKIVGKGEIAERRRSALIDRLSGELVGTGYQTIDKYLAQGFSPKHTSTIFGRTRHGKSAFKANLTVNQCRSGLSVVHITPEQGFDIEMDRLTSLISGVPLIDILQMKKWASYTDGKIVTDKKETLNRIKNATEEINSWKIFFYSGSVSLADIGRFTIETKMRHGVDIVYIDLFDRINEIWKETRNKPQVVTKGLAYLEDLADREEVHICNIVQSSRGQESRTNKRPTLVDLKESGSFEEKSWLVFSVFREHLAKEEVPDDIIEINIAKQKNGPEEKLELVWDERTLSITESIF
jgi:replicative DNA helicase